VTHAAIDWLLPLLDTDLALKTPTLTGDVGCRRSGSSTRVDRHAGLGTGPTDYRRAALHVIVKQLSKIIPANNARGQSRQCAGWPGSRPQVDDARSAIRVFQV